MKKGKEAKAKETVVVSAHKCYRLEQRANMTGHGINSKQTGIGRLVSYFLAIIINWGQYSRAIQIVQELFSLKVGSWRS